MNYLHSFHAGNFADVFKHACLLLLLEGMQRKDKPFLFLDTHAGRGLYDLQARAAQRTGEADAGIALLEHDPVTHAPFPKMRELLDKINREYRMERWRYYPGSPLWALQLLRPLDRAVFCEKNESEAKALRHSLAEYVRAQIRIENGYHALKSLLPAPEKRALVLIDPPYESDEDDYGRIVASILEGYTRMSTAVFALWYPIKTEHETARLYRALQASGMKRILVAELSIFAQVGNTGLNGSGMIFINPPFQLEQHLRNMMPTLWQRLSPQGLGAWQIKQLVGE